jgi:hypothetical protein
MEEKNVKICDLSQENTKRLSELVMMSNDIEKLLNGDMVEKLVEGEPKPISCLKEDIIAQNNQLKLLEEKLSNIINILN